MWQYLAGQTFASNALRAVVLLTFGEVTAWSWCFLDPKLQNVGSPCGLMAVCKLKGSRRPHSTVGDVLLWLSVIIIVVNIIIIVLTMIIIIIVITIIGAASQTPCNKCRAGSLKPRSQQS